jgi:hypothetical protein
MPDNEGQQARRPVLTVRYGSIKAKIWKNETQFGPKMNVTVSKSYKDGDVWKESQSFGFDDLLTLAKAVDEAHSAIARIEAEGKKTKTERRSFASRGKHVQRV